MSSHVGLDLGKSRIRAVTINRFTRAPLRHFEIDWDSAHPEAAVNLLRAKLGSAAAISLSVGLEWLQVKGISLPPVDAAAKRRMILLEPDRFFPVHAEPLALWASATSNLVFAVGEPLVEQWMVAFSEWARVECIEPAPVSFARAIGRSSKPSGTFDIQSAEGERGIVEIERGSLVAARRVANDVDAEVDAAPRVRGVPAEFLAAYGAALAANGAANEMLASSPREEQMARRRIVDVARWAAVAVFALALAAISIDRSRAQLLERTESEIADVTPKVAAALEAQKRVASNRIQNSALSQLSESGSDVLHILAALSRRMPRDAVVTTVRVNGEKWEIDGTASNASAIVPALDGDPLLREVRSRSATSRFSDAGRTLESFSIAFRASAKP